MIIRRLQGLNRRSPVKERFFLAATAVLCALPFTTYAVDAERQADVAKFGADVMPFDLKATTHIFTKTSDGGTQRVVAKDASDVQQIQRVREHLHDMQAQFQKGDFSGPSYVHDPDMPGLSQLRTAKPGKLTISYQDVASGAQLTYQTADARLVSALHTWFDAQISDHGADAMAGHPRHGDMPTQ
jgi:hypothetical protein